MPSSRLQLALQQLLFALRTLLFVVTKIAFLGAFVSVAIYLNTSIPRPSTER